MIAIEQKHPQSEEGMLLCGKDYSLCQYLEKEYSCAEAESLLIHLRKNK